MANIIAVPYSNTTPVIPNGYLYTGQVAYSNAAGDSDGGERMFMGIGTPGQLASETIVIGGEYYIRMIDHKLGHTVPSSALLTDEFNKIDLLNVDNLTLDGNTIIVQNGNNLVIDAQGENVDVNNSRIITLADPINDQDAVNKRWIQTQTTNITGDVGGAEFNVFDNNDNLSFDGGFNLNTKVTGTFPVGPVTVKLHLDSDVQKLSSLNVDDIDIDGNTISTRTGDLILDPNPVGYQGKVIIQGDLQVEGETTTINSTTLTIDDKNIVLASGAANAAAADSAGIFVEGANASIWYDASTDKWNLNKDIVAPNLQVAGAITGVYAGFDSDFAQKTTTDLTEGDNLYYTRARWDSALTTVTTTELAEGDNLYYTQARVDSAFDDRLATKTTTDVAEGSNLYYTDSRVRSAIAAVDVGGDGEFSYDSATGIFTYRGPNAAEVRAHFGAAGDLSYDSATGIFSIDVEFEYTKANFDSDLGAANTDQLPEGITNLYYTTARFDSDFNDNNTDQLSEGSTNLYFTDERVDDRIAALVNPGEALYATYDDNGNTYAINVELATATNIGGAKFDSVDFLVTAGNVEINTIDCGTF